MRGKAVSRVHSHDELKWALQALALPAGAQLNLFPDFASVTDELALDFDHWRATALGQHQLDPAQVAALASIDALLAEMTGAENVALWTDAALAQHPSWRQLREKARGALHAFGWDLATPPMDRAVFVRGSVGDDTPD